MRETAMKCFKVVDEYKIAEDNIKDAAEERLIKACIEN